MDHPVVIEDLARPRLPLPLRAFNAVARPFARGRGLSLDADRLVETARRKTGLEDLGDESFREGLHALVESIELDTRPTPLGRLISRELIVGLLANRLRLEDLIRRHPEILDEEIDAPLVIAGLPRTGTTHLHNLVAQDPRIRSLPYWEALEPVPADVEAARRGQEPDPRIKRCDQAVRFTLLGLPMFPAMHDLGTHEKHEEIQLLAMDFRSMLFEVSYWAPTYRDWYMKQDHTASYLYLRRALQALQWLRGPKRWALKSPQHLEQLGPLLAAFPDARVVQTHRDPVAVVASLSTMVAYGYRLQLSEIDLAAHGEYWADRIAGMLAASVRDRGIVPERNVIDVHFHELAEDEMAVVGRVHDLAGLDLTDEARRAIDGYRTMHRKGRFGKVDYRLEAFGLEADALRERLRFYQERFGVPSDDRQRRGSSSPARPLRSEPLAAAAPH